MPTATTNPAPERKLRLWPGIVIVALQWIAIKAPESWYFGNDTLRMRVFMFAPIVGPALFLIWWLFFSRARHTDRWLILAACVVIGTIAAFLYHKSMVMGILFIIIPVVMTAWIVWLVLGQWLSRRIRYAGLIVAMIAAWGYFAVLRFDGVDGEFNSATSYRWQETDEDRFQAAHSKMKPNAAPVGAAKLMLSDGDWPGFRGPNRDSRLAGIRIATDWDKNPPKELWRKRVGPGWSSFAVIGDKVFTQEQRGTDEAVVCYDANDGREIWAHSDAGRFEEAVAGPGPRATPTFHDGKIFAMGGAGRLNCLDAATGKLVWSRDVLKDAGAENQPWGLAASPLVHQGIVTVYAPCPRKDKSGVEDNPNEKAVLGYREGSGDLAWTAGKGAHCYSSTQLSNLNGVEQLLFLSDAGLYSFDSNGKVLWHYDWPTSDAQVARIVQPAVVGNSDVVVGTPFEKGTRRIHVNYDGDKWSTSQVSEMEAFKPYFNDFVVHDGHIYGYNGSFLICLGLDDQKIKWKERGYGNGQILLLPEQNLMLVITEKGEIALVETNPKERKELVRMPAISGKTWNHPVIANGRLFVRNAAEMACFALDVKKSPAETK